jgi:hypothetical protein
MSLELHVKNLSSDLEGLREALGQEHSGVVVAGKRVLVESAREAISLARPRCRKISWDWRRRSHEIASEARRDDRRAGRARAVENGSV